MRSAVYLDSFRLNGKVYTHAIDTRTDATYLHDQYDNLIFTVDSSARVYDHEGKLIGKFRYIPGGDYSNTWEFRGEDGTVTSFNKSDLLKCELELFKFITPAK